MTKFTMQVAGLTQEFSDLYGIADNLDRRAADCKGLAMRSAGKNRSYWEGKDKAFREAADVLRGLKITD